MAKISRFNLGVADFFSFCFYRATTWRFGCHSDRIPSTGVEEAFAGDVFEICNKYTHTCTPAGKAVPLTGAERHATPRQSPVEVAKTRKMGVRANCAESVVFRYACADLRLEAQIIHGISWLTYIPMRRYLGMNPLYRPVTPAKSGVIRFRLICPPDAA